MYDFLSLILTSFSEEILIVPCFSSFLSHKYKKKKNKETHAQIV